jgi:hypothetical protein
MGLSFDPQGKITLTSESITDVLQILDPIPDYSIDARERKERTETEAAEQRLDSEGGARTS